VYGGGLYGGSMGAIASPMSQPAYFAKADFEQAKQREADLDKGDPHLRSITEVTGYHLHATDGYIGHAQDFLVDSATWGVSYLIVDTSN
jgi:hypothetical protein